MFGIGVPELILILIVGLVVFGPGKLPEVGRAIGKSLNEFKRATTGVLDSNESQKAETTVTAEPEKKTVKEEVVKQETK